MVRMKLWLSFSGSKKTKAGKEERKADPASKPEKSSYPLLKYGGTHYRGR